VVAGGSGRPPITALVIARSAWRWRVIFIEMDVRLMVYRIARYCYLLLKMSVLLIFLFDRLRRIYQQRQRPRRVLIHQPPLRAATPNSHPKATARLYRWLKLAYLLGRSAWG